MVSSRSRRSIAVASFVAVVALVCAFVVFDAKPPPTSVAVPRPLIDAPHEPASRALETPPLDLETAQSAARAEHSSAALAEPDALTVLHVSVVAPSGGPITSGTIDVEWRGDPHDQTAPSGHVHANISGATTEMKLPLAAETCAVSASSTGYPPAQVIARGFRRLRPDAAPLAGRVDHNVRIVLGQREEGPTISGSITVNGKRRVPDALRITVNGVHAEPLIDRTNASYSISGLSLRSIEPSVIELRVESDETPIRKFTVPEPDADNHRHIDLDLESNGALFVHAIDDSSGEPAIGVALALEVNTISQRTLRATFSNTRTIHEKTDDHGDCVFHGFTQDGKLTLREAKSEKSGDAPLLTIDLAPDSPSEFHETVRVNAAKATVWGIVPAPPGSGPGLSGSYRVMRARSSPDGRRPLGDPISVLADGEARWSFECAAPSQWLVWLTQDKVRVSPTERVVVDQARSHGPVSLTLATMHAVRLQMTNLPPTGSVHMFINDEAGGPTTSETIPITASELEHAIQLLGPSRLSMTCTPGATDSRTQTHRMLRVDPQQSPVVTVDWHNDRERPIALTLNGSAPTEDCVISLMRLDEDGGVTSDGTVFSIVQGRSDRAMPISSGTYLYAILSDHDRGALYGIARVADSAELTAMKVDWRGKLVPRATLGVGIEFATLEGFSCARLRADLRQVSWPKTWGNEVTALLVPENCEYSVMK